MRKPRDIFVEAVKILGKDNISIRNDHLHKLTPKTRSELQSCIRLLNKHNIAYKIESQGKNWGYISDIKDKLVILNLSKINSIIECNSELSYIVIEPGVTFIDVYSYLKKHNIPLKLSVAGGSPEASIIGTTTQRGLGKGKYAQFFEYCCGFEVLLPNGEQINTGFNRFSNAKSKYIAKSSNGPVIDGMFTQSSLGIITKMALWLAPKPKHYMICKFSFNDKRKIKKFTDIIRKLKLHGVIQGNFLLSSVYRFLTEECQYPWDITKGKTPLSEKALAILMDKFNIKSKWVGQLIIEAYSQEILQGYQTVIENELISIVDNIEFVASNDIRKLKYIQKAFTQLDTEIKDNISSTIKMYEETPYIGIPQYRSLKSMYWRKKKKIPTVMDPIKDQCGILWFNCVIPMDGIHVAEVLRITEKVLLQYNFEPNTAFHYLTDRAVYLIGVILYDRSDAKEHKNALHCYHSLNKSLAAKGYYPYRLSERGNVDIQDQSEYGSLIDNLKKIVDPKHLLS